MASQMNRKSFTPRNPYITRQQDETDSRNRRPLTGTARPTFRSEGCSSPSGSGDVNAVRRIKSKAAPAARVLRLVRERVVVNGSYLGRRIGYASTRSW